MLLRDNSVSVIMGMLIFLFLLIILTTSAHAQETISEEQISEEQVIRWKL